MTRLLAPGGVRGARAERSRAPSVRMVIVEHGALGLDSHLSPDESDEAIVIRQCDGEHPKEWASRAIWQLTALKQSGRSVGQCTMLIVSRPDEQSMAARSALARAVLAHVGAHGTGTASTEFLLAVRGDADTEFRRDVLALVESLISAPGGSAVPIRVCFTPRDVSSSTPVGTSGFAFADARQPVGCSDAHAGRAPVDVRDRRAAADVSAKQRRR